VKTKTKPAKDVCLRCGKPFTGKDYEIKHYYAKGRVYCDTCKGPKSPRGNCSACKRPIKRFELTYWKGKKVYCSSYKGPVRKPRPLFNELLKTYLLSIKDQCEKDGFAGFAFMRG
jgi:hypothetical protein